MKKRYILCGVLVVLFMVILVSILTERSMFIDTRIMGILPNFRGDTLTKVFKLITLFGESKIILVLVVLIAGILYFTKHRADAYMLCLNLVNIVILNKGIKYLVRRPRPLNMMIFEDGYSFPSGHSMLSIGIYGFLMYLIYKSNLEKKYKVIFMTLLSIIILLTGISRMYLGVHYPSDVIGGFLITGAYLIVFISYIDRKVYKNLK